jgi:Nitrile hydratase beta subunit
MSEGHGRTLKSLPNIVKAEGEEPLFKAGDYVKILRRFPIDPFRVPNYIRGRRGRIEAVIEPPAVNNDDQGFGRNAEPSDRLLRWTQNSRLGAGGGLAQHQIRRARHSLQRTLGVRGVVGLRHP